MLMISANTIKITVSNMQILVNSITVPPYLEKVSRKIPDLFS